MKQSTKRALRTFLQAFIGYIAANIIVFLSGDIDITSKEGVKILLINLIIPALSSAIAKAMNIKDDEIEESYESEGEEGDE